MCVAEPASSPLIVSCGLSNGLNMLHKSRGSFLCARRSFDHNRARILMIAPVIRFTAGNGGFGEGSATTRAPAAGIIKRAVYGKDGLKHAVGIFYTTSRISLAPQNIRYNLWRSPRKYIN